MRFSPVPLALVLTLAAALRVFGQAIPAGYTVPDVTLSPDHRYGVTVPQNVEDSAIAHQQNEVVEVKTGRPLGAITENEVAAGHTSNQELAPTEWTADDSMLFWQVDGKWGFETEVLIRLAGGKIASQVDVLTALEQEMLRRTLAASPQQYAAVKAKSDEYGSWYQDGFAIDCVEDNTTGPMTFPLHFHVFLSSNVKGLPDLPTLESRMTAEVDRDGGVRVDEFHLGSDPPSRNW
jgi:hypothetical protein